MKTVTVQEIIDAIIKNGYNWGKFIYIRGDTEEGPSACILGQAALNLNVDPGSLGDGLFMLSRNLYVDITEYNDNRAKTYKGAARYAKRVLTPYKDAVLVLTELNRMAYGLDRE